MSYLVVQNGALIVRNGALGAGQDCCCGGCCCINGIPDNTKTTQADCEEAGGTWNSGGACRVVICHEWVWSKYSVTLESFVPITNPCQPDPVNDTSDGLIAVSAGISACGGSLDAQYCTSDWGSRCGGVPEDLQIGDTAMFNQYYERLRAVASCEDCQNTGGGFCNPGISLMGCYDWQNVGGLLECPAAADIICNNPV